MKVSNLSDAIALIEPNSLVVFGGDTLQRVPIAAVREIISQQKTLNVVKAAGSIEVDALCAAGLVNELIFAYVGYENLGLAPFFRQAVEQGRIKITEHTCPSLLAGLRAAALGVSFQPLSPVGVSEIIAANQWRTIEDPYTDEEYLAIPAICPDWAIIHVQQADIQGNARIYGPKFDDILLASSARHIIITCEELLPAYAFVDQPETIDIAGALVDKVVYAPRGAWPTSCYQQYFLSEIEIKKLVSFKQAEELFKWISALPTTDKTSPLLETPLAQQYLKHKESLIGRGKQKWQD